jgi:hypothetical protein
MKIAEVIAAITASAILLSILYLVGEGYSLKCNLLGFFEPQDLTRSTLVWLVSFLAIYTFGTIFGVTLNDPNSVENKKKILETSRHPRLSIFIRYGWLNLITIILGVQVVLSFVLYLLKKVSDSYLLYSVTFFGVLLWPDLYHEIKYHPIFQKTKQYSLLIIFAPPLMIISLVSGYSEGNKILTNKGQHSKVMIGNDSLGVSLDQIHLLNKYLIAYDTLKREIKIIPTSKISSITYQSLKVIK